MNIQEKFPAPAKLNYAKAMYWLSESKRYFTPTTAPQLQKLCDDLHKLALAHLSGSVKETPPQTVWKRYDNAIASIAQDSFKKAEEYRNMLLKHVQNHPQEIELPYIKFAGRTYYTLIANLAPHQCEAAQRAIQNSPYTPDERVALCLGCASTFLDRSV